LLAVRTGGLTAREGERDQLLNRLAFSTRKFSTVRLLENGLSPWFAELLLRPGNQR